MADRLHPDFGIGGVFEMEFQCEPTAVEELRSRRFSVGGHLLNFADLCTRGFRPSELNPVEYVELLWEEA